MQPHVLSVSSQVAYGPVGNSAAVPGLESLGLIVHQIPTVILSNHPGHGPPAGFRTEARHLGAMLDALESLGVLKGCMGVLTGYFAANDQVFSVARIIRRMKASNPGLYYLCDPVIGDDPEGLYVPLPVAEAIRDELVPLADCVAPNRFELEWLTGNAVNSSESAATAARKLDRSEILATSIPLGSAEIASVIIAGNVISVQASKKREHVAHGTGDLLSGVYLGHRLVGNTPATALSLSAQILQRVIAASSDSAVLNLASVSK